MNKLCVVCHQPLTGLEVRVHAGDCHRRHRSNLRRTKQERQPPKKNTPWTVAQDDFLYECLESGPLKRVPNAASVPRSVRQQQHAEILERLKQLGPEKTWKKVLSRLSLLRFRARTTGTEPLEDEPPVPRDPMAAYRGECGPLAKLRSNPF